MLPRRLLAPALLVLACALPAQLDEGARHFSLSTDRPVRPGEKAIVRVNTTSVEKLQFRLYRTADPYAFLQTLDDYRQFGAAPHRPVKEITPIERFRAWKERFRATLRNVLRTQYSAPQRATLRARFSPVQQKPSGPGAEYAAIPVLNPQRLVRTWEQAVVAASRWESVNVPVETPGAGLYVLEATDGKLQAYTLIFVTDLAIITKSVPGRLLVRVVDRRSGAPISAAALLLSEKSARGVIARAQTGNDGLAELALPGDPADELLLAARTSSDFAAQTVSGWSLNTDPARHTSGLLYTDRPVYRPGHKVHFKAILRTSAASGYRLPAAPQIPVQIEDPEGRPVLKQTLTLSPYGTVKGELTLTDDVPLGYYSVRAGPENGAVYGGFHVEEYRKPEYEVRVAPAQKRVVQGAALEAVIQARYYYGEPVANAKVIWVVHRSRWWRPYEMEEAGSDDAGEGGYYGAEQISENQGRLDADGRLAVSVPTTRGDHDFTYRVEARVTGSEGREIAGAGSFLATQGAFYLDARPSRWVYSPGDNVTFNIESRDYDGNPAPGIPLRAVLSTWTWQPNQRTTPVLERSATTGADGRAAFEFPAPAAGSYQLAVSAASSGNAVSAATYLWIAGDAGAWGSSGQRIRIVPDKTSYRPGDTARLLIVTGAPGAELWLTTEGRSLHSSRFVSAKGASISVDVPILAEYAPNFYVEAVFVKDNKLWRGSKSVKVPPIEKLLEVQVKTAKAEYRPGEQATFQVEARDHQGRPVAAEVSLGVVDEAIYAIRRDPHPDISKVFYGRLYNQVSTDSSFYFYFHGEAGSRRMRLARLRPSTARAQLKPERLAEPKIRRAFPDTLLWIADLKTDASGRAQVQAEFPDALTQWRATARAITTDTRVGGAVERTTVRKNIIVSMAAPRFLTEGDEIVIPVLARNYLATPQKLRVSLEAQGLELAGAVQELEVAPRGEARVDWRARVPRERGKVVLLAKALGAQESDALELTLPVQPQGVKLSAARSGSLSEPSARADLNLAAPARSQPHTRSLEVQLTPSLAGALFGALEYLTSYPYGCVEQTMSSFLPNIIVSRTLRDLQVPSAVDDKELRRKVRAGLERLYDFQHEDGGWGWWRGDESHPFMTAYVLAGLASARRAGYSLREDSLNRGRGAVVQLLDSGGKLEPDVSAYLVYALALSGDTGRDRFSRVYGQRANLTPYGLALLGLAARELTDARAAEIATRLEASVQRQGPEASWPSQRDTLLDFVADATPEATAAAMKFLAAERPASPLLEPAAIWLLNHRSEGYYWNSTKQTALVVDGLTGWLKQSGELKPDYEVTLSVNGKPAARQRFSAADALTAKPFVLRVPAAQTGESNRIEIVKQGAGRLYWSARAEGYVIEDQGLRAGSPDFQLTREYFRLAAVTDAGRVQYALQPFSGAARVGEVIAVRLTLAGSGRYLLLEDPIPAGAEPVDRDERYELRDRPGWWISWADRRELRDNRAVYFENRLASGERREFVYLIRVTNPGRFSVGGARVQPMYQPRTLSTTPSWSLEVQP